MEYQNWDGSGLARPRRDSPWSQELLDKGMTMAELVERVYKLLRRENLSFFIGSDGRFRSWKISRRNLKPSRRPASIEGGQAASRKPSRFRGISVGAGRRHR